MLQKGLSGGDRFYLWFSAPPEIASSTFARVTLITWQWMGLFAKRASSYVSCSNPSEEKLSQLWLNISHAQKQGLQRSAVSKITAYYGENLIRVFKCQRLKQLPRKATEPGAELQAALTWWWAKKLGGRQGSRTALCNHPLQHLRHSVIHCGSGSVPVCRFGGGALGPLIQHYKRETILRKKGNCCGRSPL